MCWVIISVYLWILCCVRDVYADFNFGPQLFAEEVWSPVMWRMRLIYFTKDLVWHLLLHWAENFAPTSQIQLHCCTFAPLGTFHHMNWSWLVTVSRMMLFVERGQELLLACSMKQGDMAHMILCLRKLNLTLRCLHLLKCWPCWKRILIWHQCLRVEHDSKDSTQLVFLTWTQVHSTLNNLDGWITLEAFQVSEAMLQLAAT